MFNKVWKIFITYCARFVDWYAVFLNVVSIVAKNIDALFKTSMFCFLNQLLTEIFKKKNTILLMRITTIVMRSFNTQFVPMVLIGG